jgi:hypothetical protein
MWILRSILVNKLWIVLKKLLHYRRKYELQTITEFLIIINTDLRFRILRERKWKEMPRFTNVAYKRSFGIQIHALFHDSLIFWKTILSYILYHARGFGSE